MSEGCMGVNVTCYMSMSMTYGCFEADDGLLAEERCRANQPNHGTQIGN
jgi:hypothetical protein